MPRVCTRQTPGGRRLTSARLTHTNTHRYIIYYVYKYIAVLYIYNTYIVFAVYVKP